jgi:hypothetical protein
MAALNSTKFNEIDISYNVNTVYIVCTFMGMSKVPRRMQYNDM